MLKGNGTFYATLNPVSRQVHARAANRLKPYADVTTSDSEILWRRYFLIDCDPSRPRGVSSTEVELAGALARRDEIVTWLSDQGWPAAIRAMSGNGGHAFTYNGTSWSAPVVVDRVTSLVSVSCPTTSFCAAVGDDGSAFTYDGSSWTTSSGGRRMP